LSFFKSFRSSEAVVHVLISTSTSPSLSKSPKAHRGSSAFPESGARLAAHVFESAAAAIVQKHARVPVFVFGEVLFHFGVDAAVYEKQVRPSVVIEIVETGAHPTSA